MRAERQKRKNKCLRSIMRLLVLALFGVLLLYVHLWNTKMIERSHFTMPFGYGAAVILSGSMEPVLSVHDLVFVKKSENFEVGDIVVFPSANTLIVHRVVEIDDGMVTTQGDGNNVADEPISSEMVMGVVVARIPMAGAFIREMKTPLGLVTLFMLVFLMNEKALFRERKAEDNEPD